jgi:uncharacterized protein YndB with AHSA1/START domain
MEIERTVDLPADADEVWDALTDDEALDAWFGDSDDREARRSAVVEEAEPGRRLAWTWWPEGDGGDASRVEITLLPLPDGTRLTVTEARPLVATASVWHDRLVGLELCLMVSSARTIRC